jgi:hypothetical protein
MAEEDKDELARVSKNYLLALNSDEYTEQDAINYLKDRGYDSPDRSFAQELKEKKNDKGFWEGIASSIGGGLKKFNEITDSTIDAATWGTTIYLNAGVKSVKEGIPFDRALGQVRSARKKVREEHPILTGIGEAVGFVGSGMGSVGSLQKAVPILKTAPGQTLKNLPKEIVTGSGTAAAESGFTALAKGEDAGAATAFGLMFGAGGGTLPALFTGTKNMIKAFKGSAFDTTTGSQGGWEKVSKWFTKDGEVKPTVTAKINRADELGMGDDMMAVDLLNEQELIDAGALLRKGNPEGKVVGPAINKLKERLTTIKEKSGDYLSEAMGHPKRESMLKLSDDLQEAARLKSEPHYNQSFYEYKKEYVINSKTGKPEIDPSTGSPKFEYVVDDAGKRVFDKSRAGLRTISDDRLDELFMNEEFRDAYEKVVEIARKSTVGGKSPKVLLEELPTMEALEANMKLVPPFKTPMGRYSVYALDKVKKFLDTKYKGSQLPGADTVTAELASDIRTLKHQMLDIMTEKDESYKTARGIFRGEQELDEAKQLGEDLFKRGLNGPDAQYLLKQNITNPEELAQYKVGAYNSLVDMIEKSGKDVKNPKGVVDFFEDPQNLDKLDLILTNPNLTKAQNDTLKWRFIDRMEVMGNRIYVAHHLTGGSQTATRLAAEGGLAQQAIRAGTSVARRDIPGMISQGVDMVRPGMIAKQADAQGQHVFQQGAGQIDQGLKKGLLVQEEMRKKVGDPMGLLGIATGGVSTGSSYTQ